MRSQRKKYLQDFLKSFQGRDATGIQQMRITIRKQDWLQAFKTETLNNYKGSDKKTLEKAIDIAFDKEWKEIQAVIRKWYGSGKPRTWAKQSRTAKAGVITIKVKNTSKASKKWYQNAVVSLKRPLNKWAQKKAYVKRIIAEHGRQLEIDQQVGGQMTIPGQGNVVNRPGSAGNNMQTSIIKAMNDTVSNDEWWISFLVSTVQGYLHAKINSRIDKRKTKNSIHRNHFIEFIIAPNTKQGGKPDKDDGKEFESIFRTQFNSALKKKMKAMRDGKVPRKEIAAFASDSPDIFDEFSDFGDDKAVEIMEQEARKQMRKANAQMAGVGKGTKTKISFSKNLENIRATKKIGKAIEVMRKGADKVTTKTVASQVASPPMSKMSKGQRASAQMGPGFRMDKEGLLIKNMINNILPRAIEANMGSPRLNNQTGKFASSAKVDNVVVGPRGGLYIGYTYPQRPYGVFEPGHGRAPWANQYRDPRHIIGKSIREIVAVNMRGQTVSGLTREFE